MLMTPGGEILGGLSISLFFLWSCPLLYKVYRLVKSEHNRLLGNVWENVFYLVFLRQFSYITPAGLKLLAVLLPWLPECWGHKCVPPSAAATNSVSRRGMGDWERAKCDLSRLLMLPGVSVHSLSWPCVCPSVHLAVSRPLHSSAVKAAATFVIPVDPRLLAHPAEATLPSGLSVLFILKLCRLAGSQAALH